MRLRVEPSDASAWRDEVIGEVDSSLLGAGGDFVLCRADGVFAYQLAVAVDDLAMGITDVVRGDDLVASTPRQILLMRLWRRCGVPWARQTSVPRYWHLPLVRGADGARLAKRAAGATVCDLRASGVRPERVLGHLAFALGIVPSTAPIDASQIARIPSAGVALRREPWTIPRSWD
jgi:glutamyl-tRNA synthetase